MIRVHHSNRTEILLSRFLAVTADPPGGVLSPETCVVQSPGMGRWLSQQIAVARGIAAGIEFPLPASFVWNIYRRVLENVPERSVFQRESLVWRIMGRLDAHLGDPPFAELNAYLADGPSDLKKFQLSQRIADAFDQYLVYRPEMILGWENGADEHWQASLWRALSGGVAESHRARLWKDFRTVAETSLDPSVLPERVSLFGITALAPAYLDVVSDLAAAIEVHVFVLNPCMEYWGDIEDERGLARRRRHWRRRGLKDAAAYFESGNPLLASLGKVGREFQDQLLEVPSEPMDAFQAPDAGHLLGCMQSDILELRDGTREMRVLHGARGWDTSVQLHSCHSQLREVQVLHDRILEMIETLPSLAPREIVVMAPEIDVYAPLVEAVFGAAHGARHLPFSIADRSAWAQDPLVDAFFVFLDLGQSRLGLSEVLDWLQIPSVMRRFNLDEQGFEQVRTWASEAGVRWGADSAMRGELGLPESEENTWSFGFDRLFAGYAMPADERLFEGILPYPHIEGAEVAVLGHLRTFVELLVRWRGMLSGRYSAIDWQERVNALLEEFFSPEEAELDGLQSIRDAMQSMVREAQEEGFGGLFGVDLLKASLKPSLGVPSAGGRFLDGGITFCNLVPMRSIPFRVVCLLGMNDDAFPRVQRPVGFDLIARDPRVGDRSRRADDRYLFLESLLSARDVFYLSFVGHDQRDNSDKVPAVVASELLDYLDAAYTMPAADHGDAIRVTCKPAGLRALLLTEHPLQPFSRRCFDPTNTRTWSYGAEWFPSTRPVAGRVFADQPLADEIGEDVTIHLDALLRFFNNPSRFFLRERLRIDLHEENSLSDDVEPFAIDALQTYLLRQEALEHALSGEGSGRHREIARARGELPPGELGDIRYGEMVVPQVEQFAAELRHLQAGALVSVPVVTDVLAPPVAGTLTGLSETGMLLHRLGKLRAKDRLGAWIRHLMLNIACPEGIGLTTRFLGSDKLLTLPPIEDAALCLRSLVVLYRQGWSRPLPFFPECSYEYAIAIHRGKSERVARAIAEKCWAPWGSAGAGERDDLAVRVAFRDADQFAEPFASIAMDVFDRLLAVAEEIGHGAT